ncbi:unnamed protein product [Euphydryas editha]|uniref:Uncharacterized protein n=1 Tax=Euphydryas editha TaxID=104508 RepID=A0AAU9UAI2_EUPED|nr:unnamed protein product [Euphydryas editha]
MHIGLIKFNNLLFTLRKYGTSLTSTALTFLTLRAIMTTDAVGEALRAPTKFRIIPIKIPVGSEYSTPGAPAAPSRSADWRTPTKLDGLIRIAREHKNISVYRAKRSLTYSLGAVWGIDGGPRGTTARGAS